MKTFKNPQEVPAPKKVTSNSPIELTNNSVEEESLEKLTGYIRYDEKRAGQVMPIWSGFPGNQDRFPWHDGGHSEGNDWVLTIPEGGGRWSHMSFGPYIDLPAIGAFRYKVIWEVTIGNPGRPNDPVAHLDVTVRNAQPPKDIIWERSIYRRDYTPGRKTFFEAILPGALPWEKRGPNGEVWYQDMTARILFMANADIRHHRTTIVKLI